MNRGPSLLVSLLMALAVLAFGPTLSATAEEPPCDPAAACVDADPDRGPEPSDPRDD